MKLKQSNAHLAVAELLLGILRRLVGALLRLEDDEREVTLDVAVAVERPLDVVDLTIIMNFIFKEFKNIYY